MASRNHRAQVSLSPPTSPLEVLLIEDNSGDARLFEEYPSESSTEVTLRREPTLEAGPGALNADRPGVLVVDLLLDSEEGETVKAVVGAAPELPVVVLTGQEDLRAALQVQEAGAVEYLQKSELTPYRRDERSAGQPGSTG